MKRTERIALAIVIMVSGVLLIAMRDAFIGVLMTVAGVSLIVLGILECCQRRLPPAIVKWCFGVLTILCGWLVVEGVLYVLAAVLLTCGALTLYDRLKKCRHCASLVETLWEYAPSSLFLTLGFLFLLHEILPETLVFALGGVLVILLGIAYLSVAVSEEK